ncbi:AAA family ATPase [Clostridium tyrobutyricum]|uniref:AAA family ATPase n=1 Tax=Clostridium tyrobutyricum TaxID=1519 RepID=UPI001C385B4D|nr:ATP-binding protein [Clostridium tyrobutyricum]MBV4445948.1 AAA family ATPase [Clostridium tyrobutyricum]
MLIQKIKISGYKNISDTIIKFQNLIALVGINNYGKSNVIEAIDFAREFILSNPEMKHKMMRYLKAIPLNITIANDNFVFEMEYISKLDQKTVFVDYEIEFKWFKNNVDDKGCKIVGENLKIKLDKKGQKYSSYINRSENKAFYRTSETGRCDKNISIERDNLIINKINSYDDLFYVDIIKELNTLKFDVNSFLDSTNAFDVAPTLKFKNSSLFGLDKKTGDNISEIVYNLKREDKKSYRLLENSFKELFPTIEYINILSFDITNGTRNIKIPNDAPFIIPDKIYRLRVKEDTNNQEMDFANLSNGTKRIFLLLTSAILADKYKFPLIAFEELEDCIHPSLFEQLLIILSKIVNNCRIVITSHSPFLIQYLDLDKIYISIPSKRGVATFKKIKKSKQNSLKNEAKEYGISVGGYLFDLIIKCYDGEYDLLSFMESE